MDYLEQLVFLAALLLCDFFSDLNNKDTVSEKKLIINNIFAALLLVISQYAKFSYFHIAFVLLIIFAVIYSLKRNYMAVIFFIGSYIVFSILLWIISGQHIKYLFTYFYYSLQISSGYNSTAMSVFFTEGLFFRIFILAILIIIPYVLTMGYFAFNKKVNYFLSMFFLSPQIFLLFKQSFVRADGHAYAFLNNVPIIVLYLLFVFSMIYENNVGGKPIDKKHQLKLFGDNTSRYFLIAAIFIIILVSNNFLPRNRGYEILHFYNEYEQNIEHSKYRVRNDYIEFEEILPYIRPNKKTDIFPWDISLLYAYGLDWQPRPVIQSYSNYTTSLDRVTSKHFLKENAPETLIFGPHITHSIDGRYGLFDEPETFRTVLLNYEPVARNDSFLVLERKQQVIEPVLTFISNYDVKIGEIITIPFLDNAYVFMKIDWGGGYHIFGRFVNFLFQTNRPYIELILNDGRKISHRFVHNVAKNGLFVSKYISDPGNLQNVFNGSITQDIVSVRIIAKNLFFKNNIGVSFYSTPRNNLIRDVVIIGMEKYYLDYPFDLDSLIENTSAVNHFNLDSINNSSPSQDLFLDEDFIEIRGWTADEVAGHSFDKVILKINDKYYSCLPIVRRDVANHFGTESYLNSGFSTRVDKESFNIGENKIEFFLIDEFEGVFYKKEIIVFVKNVTR